MENDKEMSEDNKVTQQQVAENESALGREELEAHAIEQRDDQGDHAVDFSGWSKRQLLDELKEQLKKGEYIHADTLVNELKSTYDEIFERERGEALHHFVSEGGIVDDFEYRKTDEDRDFFNAFGEFKKRRGGALKELEQSRDKNLFIKNQILDRLRELVDGEETTDSISTIKKIQEEWKAIGPVPANQNKNLWASYNALMDRYYDNRSIYFELKELDRRKNLESKIELCAKAESLQDVEDLKEAIRQLNDLHEEFKHIGPVPREEQEELWTRFKAASDAVYLRRKDYYEDQKEVFKRNLEVKEQLIQKLESLQDFKGERIKEWNAKTKEVLDIQKEWEAIGPVPKENGKEINKAFWGYFKKFFHNKNVFFKELDELRLVNKEKAEALITEAEAQMKSTDWHHASSILIKLQEEWKQLGPTPEKHRNELYRRFKTACDTFFDNRRQANKEASKEYEENLALKTEVCNRIVQESEGHSLSPDKLEELIKEYNAIGFVPRKNIKEAAAKFNEAVERYIAKMGDEGVDLDDFMFRLNLNKIQADPNSNRVLNKKEHGIRKQISDLENNITLWKNNLEFFAASRTADKLKNQFDEKIDKAELEIEKLKKRLSIIREF